MDPSSTPEVFTAIGAALAGVSVFAVIKVVRMFLKHIDTAETRQERFLGNHMSANVRAQEAHARAAERVADRLARLEDIVRSPSTVKVVKANEVEVNP